MPFTTAVTSSLHFTVQHPIILNLNFSSLSNAPKSIPFCVSEMSQGTLQRKLMRRTSCCHQEKYQGYIQATDSGEAGQGAGLFHFSVPVSYQAARQAHSEKEDGLMLHWTGILQTGLIYLPLVLEVIRKSKQFILNSEWSNIPSSSNTTKIFLLP